MKIGIDIGGSHVAVGLIEDNGKIINKLEEDIKKKETYLTLICPRHYTIFMIF